MTPDDEMAAWLRLLETPKVGRESARKLLSAFGSPEAVLSATTAARREVVPAAVATALATAPEAFPSLLHTTREWLRAGIDASPRSVIPLGDPRYPASLLESADPPLLLYAQGQVEWLQAPSIGMVGSRKPTPQGLQNAEHFAEQLSRAGLTVVSGLALGIDGAAHEGALKQAGRTVAVVGTGLDRMYPRRHLALARRIATMGLIVSEYALGTPPLAAHFPQRNRIVAGLSRGVLVVEAALQSGSLISARLALESDRDVFAIPGSIHAPQSRGCHALIKQGAKLVETVDDILDELRWHPRPSPAPGDHDRAARGRDATDPVLSALAFDIASLEALMARTGLSAAALQGRLLELEFEGRVAKLPGQFFQRIGLA
jgi:DNA processing protein